MQGGRTIVDEEVPGRQRVIRDGRMAVLPWRQRGLSLATGTTAVKPEWSFRTYPVKVVDGVAVIER